MLKVKARGKWLVPLALCLCCLVACLPFISAATLADPDTGDALASAATRTVAMNTLTPAKSPIGWLGPASYTDNLDAAHAGSFKATASATTPPTSAEAQYNIWNKGYTKLTGKIYPLKGNVTTSSLKVTITADDGIPVTAEKVLYGETQPKIRSDSLVTSFEVQLADIYDVLTITVTNEDTSGTAASVIFSDMVFTQADAAAAPRASDKTTGLQTLPATKQNVEGPGTYTDSKNTDRLHSLKATAGSTAATQAYLLYTLNKGYTKLTGKVACLQGTSAAADLTVKIYASPAAHAPLYTIASIRAGGDPKSFEVNLSNATLLAITVSNADSAAASLVLYDLVLTQAETAPPVTPGRYRAVDGYRNLYERLDADDRPLSPRRYILSATAPTNGSAPPAGAREAYASGGMYYVQIAEGSGIFLAVNTDGTLSASALWWGLDGVFGTADDLSTSVMEDNGYYYWRQAEGVWQMILGMFNPDRTTTTTTTTTTTGTTASTISITGDDYQINPDIGKPGTGAEFNPAVAVCTALLLMGCGYCGFQVFRRRTVKVR